VGVPAALSFGDVDPDLFSSVATLTVLASSIADAVTAVMQTRESAGATGLPASVTITQVQDLGSSIIMYRGGGAGTQTATASPSSSFGAGAGAGRRRRLQAGGATTSAVQVSYVVLLPPGTSRNQTGYVRALLAPFVQGQASPPGFDLFTATTIQNIVTYSTAAGAADLASGFAGATVVVAAPAYVPPRSIPSQVAPAGIVAKTVGGILGGVVLLLALRQYSCPGRAQPKLVAEPVEPPAPPERHGPRLVLRAVHISSPTRPAAAPAAASEATAASTGLHTSAINVDLVAPSRRGSTAATAVTVSASRRASAAAASPPGAATAAAAAADNNSASRRASLAAPHHLPRRDSAAAAGLSHRRESSALTAPAGAIWV